MRTTLRTVALLCLLAVLVAACAEDEATDLTEDEPADEPEEEPEDAPEDEAADEAVDASEEDAAVVATTSTDLGEILVDEDGMTLYMFDPDEQGESTCDGTCAENWPPLVTEADPVADQDAQEELLGTTERDDGSMQVTYDDWPLYAWAGDDASGDTNGQGVEDVWWVLDPDGMPLRDAEPEDAEQDAEADADDDPSGGY